METLLMSDIIPFSQLLDESGLKTEYFMRLFQFTNRTSWYRKRENLANWSVEDIYIIAQALHRTPAEIFEALHWEVKHTDPQEIPPRRELPKKSS